MLSLKNSFHGLREAKDWNIGGKVYDGAWGFLSPHVNVSFSSIANTREIKDYVINANEHLGFD